MKGLSTYGRFFETLARGIGQESVRSAAHFSQQGYCARVSQVSQCFKSSALHEKIGVVFHHAHQGRNRFLNPVLSNQPANSKPGLRERMIESADEFLSVGPRICAQTCATGRALIEVRVSLLPAMSTESNHGITPLAEDDPADLTKQRHPLVWCAGLGKCLESRAGVRGLLYVAVHRCRSS